MDEAITVGADWREQFRRFVDDFPSHSAAARAIGIGTTMLHYYYEGRHEPRKKAQKKIRRASKGRVQFVSR